jgi:hypothetical protein
MKKNNIIPLLILGILLLTSCCRDCLITNRELSSLKTFQDDNNNTVLKINSAWKSVELLMSNNIGIQSYSIEGKNILSKIYPGLIKTTYILDKSDKKSNNIEFQTLENDIIGSNSAILSDISKDKKLKIRDVRKYSMNLDNGNLYITEELFNDQKLPLHIIQNDELNLKNGGYLLLPLSIISNINAEGWRFTGKNKKEDFIEKNINKSGNWLIVHAVPGIEIEADPNSGWYAYLKDGMLFIKEFNNKNVNDKRVNKFFNIKVDEDCLSINQEREEKTVLPDSSIRDKQRWSIVPVDKKVNSLLETVVLFRNMEFKLKLLINRR